MRRFHFVGLPRSGHTIVGAALDAHPAITCGYEGSLVARAAAGATGPELDAICERHAAEFAAAGLRPEGRPYCYAVPGWRQGQPGGLWRGATGVAPHLPGAHAELWDAWQPDVLVHVVRNPLEVAVTFLAQGLGGHAIPDWDAAADWVVRYHAATAEILELAGARDIQVVHVLHEVACAFPNVALHDVLAKLSLTGTAAYWRAMAKLFWRSHKRRFQERPDRPPAAIAEPLRKADHPWLRYYFGRG